MKIKNLFIVDNKTVLIGAIIFLLGYCLGKRDVTKYDKEV